MYELTHELYELIHDLVMQRICHATCLRYCLNVLIFRL